MLSFCKNVVWLINAPVATKSTLSCPPGQPRQDAGAKHGGAAPRPGSAAFHLLPGRIVEQAPAVQVVLHQQPLCCQQFMQQPAAHLSQVSGIDAVVVLGVGMGILKIAQQSGCCSWRHSRPMLLMSLMA